MSPLTEDALYCHYSENPFESYFDCGLKESLFRQLHLTQDPITEEYAIAAKMWKLNFQDMCEIAQNSVLISGFEEN